MLTFQNYPEKNVCESCSNLLSGNEITSLFQASFDSVASFATSVREPNILVEENAKLGVRKTGKAHRRTTGFRKSFCLLADMMFCTTRGHYLTKPFK